MCNQKTEKKKTKNFKNPLTARRPHFEIEIENAEALTKDSVKKDSSSENIDLINGME